MLLVDSQAFICLLSEYEKSPSFSAKRPNYLTLVLAASGSDPQIAAFALEDVRAAPRANLSGVPGLGRTGYPCSMSQSPRIFQATLRAPRWLSLVHSPKVVGMDHFPGCHSCSKAEIACGMILAKYPHVSGEEVRSGIVGAATS
jgi:hypothetical protein